MAFDPTSALPFRRSGERGRAQRRALQVASRAAAIALLATAAGCGNVERGGKGEARIAPGGSVRVTAREYGFSPARITVTGPGRVRFVVRDAGSLPHDLRLRDSRGRDLGGTPAFTSGTRSATFTLSPGRYVYYCSIGDHEKLGMRGTLVVAQR